MRPDIFEHGVRTAPGCHNQQQSIPRLIEIRLDTIKSGPLVDMGSVTESLPEDVRKLFQQMTDSFRDRFAMRVATARPTMSAADRRAIADGRVVPAPQALALHS